MSMPQQDVSGSVVITKSSRHYWGPLIWKTFHLLSEISDRTDISLLWKKWIKQTAVIMPCERCRRHLDHHLRMNPFINHTDPLSMSGYQTQIYIRNEIMRLHNTVNIHIGKPVFTQYDYEQMYIKNRTRESILLESSNLMSELDNIFVNLEYIKANKYIYNLWKKSYTMLASLLVVGTNDSK